MKRRYWIDSLYAFSHFSIRQYAQKARHLFLLFLQRSKDRLPKKRSARPTEFEIDRYILSGLPTYEPLADGSGDWEFSPDRRSRLSRLGFDALRWMEETAAAALVRHWLDERSSEPDRYEGHSLSRRLRNLLWWYDRYGSDNTDLLTVIHQEWKYLCRNPEYHLRNNHLLENALSMVMGSLYFKDDTQRNKSLLLLDRTLSEQILDDGAHVEGSPFYHHLCLQGLLELLRIQKIEDKIGAARNRTYRDMAARMLGWSDSIRFTSGRYPVVNDSVEQPWPSFSTLQSLASSVGIHPIQASLSASGFRMMRSARMELFLDIGGLSPRYAVGHQHADVFNTLMEIDGQPLLVEAGVSTYALGGQRHFERSTAAHTTVSLGEHNQARPIGSFRFGRLPAVKIVTDRSDLVEAIHDGFSSMGFYHRRKWEINDDEVVITDDHAGSAVMGMSAYFHVHKNAMKHLAGQELITRFARIRFEGSTSVCGEESSRSTSFHHHERMITVRVDFDRRLRTIITLNQRHETTAYTHSALRTGE